MSGFRISLLFGFLVVLLTLAAFSVDFWLLQGSLPGYKVLVFPGIVAARLFSEELDFLPKLGVVLLGQFVAYFIVGVMMQKLLAYIRKCALLAPLLSNRS